jgi:hypothetical protein
VCQRADEREKMPEKKTRFEKQKYYDSAKDWKVLHGGRGKRGKKLYFLLLLLTFYLVIAMCFAGR